MVSYAKTLHDVRVIDISPNILNIFLLEKGKNVRIEVYISDAASGEENQFLKEQIIEELRGAGYQVDDSVPYDAQVTATITRLKRVSSNRVGWLGLALAGRAEVDVDVEILVNNNSRRFKIEAKAISRSKSGFWFDTLEWTPHTTASALAEAASEIVINIQKS